MTRVRDSELIELTAGTEEEEEEERRVVEL